MKLAVDGKVIDVVLAPPVRMDFRGLTIETVKPGGTVSVEAYPNKQNANEVRAITLSINNRNFELR
jgi:hypothetical protein